MYELMARFWLTADQDPASTPPMVEFARIWREMPKLGFSRTLEHVAWNSTIVRDVVAADDCWKAAGASPVAVAPAPPGDGGFNSSCGFGARG
jgi:hypothetical protein